MPTPVIWSAPELVNTTTSGDQLGARVTALPGGGYVVVWEGPHPVYGAPAVFAQVYDAFGTPVGAEMVPSDDSFGTNPAVVALADGTFVVAWQGSYSGEWGVNCQIFSSEGSPIGSVFPGSTDTDPMVDTLQFYPTMTALKDGGFVVAYQSYEAGGAVAVKLDRFDASGAKVGPTIVAYVDPDANIGDVKVQDIENGGFAVTWAEGPAGSEHIYGRIYSDDGVAQTPDPVLLTPAADRQWGGVMASDGDHLLLVWFDANGTEVWGRLLDAAGNEIKAAFQISDESQNGSGSSVPTVTKMPNGTYLVVWWELDNNKPMFVGQLLDADGSKIGTELVLLAASTDLQNIERFGVSALSDGRVVIAWSGEHNVGGDTADASTHSMIVDLRDGVIEGTDEADYLLGSIDGTADIITAKDGNDEVYGLDGNDTILGDGGNDTIKGGAGADSMTGGSGNDNYEVENAGDVVVEAVGGGTDRIAVFGLDYVLAAGLEIEQIEMFGNVDTDITGNEFGQLLKGDGSNNKLMGMGGNDTLDGGSNFDHMEGGAGDDLYLVDMQIEHVVELANEGIDTVQTKGISFSLESWDNVENLTLVGGGDLHGTGNGLNNVITGNDNDNTLDGKDGNDTLIGGESADTMYGGTGDDTYEVDHVNDEVHENASEGIDTVKSFIDYTLGEDVENLTLMASVVSGSGNDLANLITGNGAGNVLTGLGGDDTLDGQGGNDTMAGGTRDDTYIVGQAGDVVTELFDQGADTVVASLDYTLGANVENLVLAAGTNATGNEHANGITGNAGANIIDGKAGADTMTGLAGDDQYVVDDAGDVVKEVAKGGFDTVTAFVDHTLGAFVEKLVLAGGTNATGNNLANEIVGNAGANIIDGKQNNDTMTGLAGDDTYVVTETGDVVVEAANSGTDTVIAFLDYALTDNVENLTLVAGSQATGNALANAIIGNAGANVIDGQIGADTMTGLAGDDIYIVDNAGDVIVEDVTGGIDTVHAGVNYTLAGNLEALTLTGNAAKGTGNGGANTLIGNALANTLRGGAGNDTIDGGGGKDALDGGAGNDTFVLGSSADKVKDTSGVDDTITSTISRKLADFAGIENLKLEGTAKINGTGNAVDNDLVGNAGKNQLKGEAGNDLLRGMGGADQLWGGAGKDTFDFDAISDIKKATGKRDIVKDFEHGKDKIDLSTIDANGLVGGDQKFKFKAAEGSAFTHVAGQLIWDQKDVAGTSHDMTLVSGDINGDGVADFTLELSGLVNLTKGDFIL